MKYLFPFIVIVTLILSCSRSGRKTIRDKKNASPRTEKQTIIPKEGFIDKPADNSNETTDKLNSLSQLYEEYKNSVFLIYTSDGQTGRQGSGFFITNTGIAISNYHVFEKTTIGLENIVTLENDKFKVNKVLSKDKNLDYIIFKVAIPENYYCNPIPISSNNPKVGEDVFAIGNPRGLESTLSKGIISGYREQNKIIQTTTEITHGSSGGPLINMKGEVVGITSSGFGEANLNFAINLNSIPLDRILR